MPEPGVDRMSNIERYEWLTVHDDGSLSADLRDTSPAETDRRMVITQELLAGRVVLAADHRGAAGAISEAIAALEVDSDWPAEQLLAAIGDALIALHSGAARGQ
jgi:hypothetical protein